MAYGDRLSSQDVAGLNAYLVRDASNDGTYLYFLAADINGNGAFSIRAYNISDQASVSGRTSGTITHPDGGHVRGMDVNAAGTIAWVSVENNANARAYNIPAFTRNSAMDRTIPAVSHACISFRPDGSGVVSAYASTDIRKFNTSGVQIASADYSPSYAEGIYTDGVAVLLVLNGLNAHNPRRGVVGYAYSNLARDTTKDFGMGSGDNEFGANAITVNNGVAWDAGGRAWDVTGVDSQAPATPANLSLVVDSNIIRADWDDVTGATTYELRRRPAITQGNWTEITGFTMSSGNLPGLATSTLYEVQVRSRNAAGASDWSASVTATTGQAVSDRVWYVGTPPAGFVPEVPPANKSHVYYFWNAANVHNGPGNQLPHPQALRWPLAHEVFDHLRNTATKDGVIHAQGWVTNIAVSNDSDRAARLAFAVIDRNPFTGINMVGQHIVAINTNARATSNPAGDGVITNDRINFSAINNPTPATRDGLADMYFDDGFTALTQPQYPTLNFNTQAPYRFSVSVEGDPFATNTNFPGALLNDGPTLLLHCAPGVNGLGTAANAIIGALGTRAAQELMVRLQVDGVFSRLTYHRAIPSDLTARNEGVNTILGWDAEDAPVAYDVRWREVGQTAWAERESLTNSLTVRLEQSKRYEFQVRAKSPGFLSHWSGSFVFLSPSVLLIDPGGNGSKLYFVNPDSGARTFIVNTNIEGQIRLAYNHQTGELFGLDQSGAQPALYIINVSNGALTRIAHSRLPNQMTNGLVRCMGWHEGRLYLVNAGYTARLWEITPSSTNWAARSLANYRQPQGGEEQAVQSVGDTVRLLVEPTGALATGANVLRTYIINPANGAIGSEHQYTLATYQDSGTKADFAAAVWHGNRIAILGWRAANLGRWQSISVGGGARVDTDIDYAAGTAGQVSPWDLASTIPGVAVTGIQVSINGVDVTEYQTGFAFNYGRLESSWLAKSGGLVGQIELGKAPANVVDSFLPNQPVAISYLLDGTLRPLCEAYIRETRESINHSNRYERAYITLKGSIGQLEREDFEVALFQETSFRTTGIIQEILRVIEARRPGTFPTARRKIGYGQVRVHPAHYQDTVVQKRADSALKVVRAMEEAEVGFVHEGRGSDLVFEHRFFRELSITAPKFLFGGIPIGSLQPIGVIGITEPKKGWDNVYNAWRVGYEAATTQVAGRVYQWNKPVSNKRALRTNIIPANSTINILLTLNTVNDREDVNMAVVEAWTAPAAGDFGFERVSTNATTPHVIGTTGNGVRVSIDTTRDTRISRYVTVQNTNAFDVRMVKAELQGRGVLLFGDLVLPEIQDAASIALYGRRARNIPASIVGDGVNHEGDVALEGHEYAQALLQRYKNPIAYGRLRFNGTENPVNRAAMVGVQVSDPVTVSGNTGMPSGGYYIEGVSMAHSAGDGQIYVEVDVSQRGQKTNLATAAVNYTPTTAWADVQTPVTLPQGANQSAQGRAYVAAATAMFPAVVVISKDEDHTVLRLVRAITRTISGTDRTETQIVKTWTEDDIPLGGSGEPLASLVVSEIDSTIKSETLVFQARIARTGGPSVTVSRVVVNDVTW